MDKPAWATCLFPEPAAQVDARRLYDGADRVVPRERPFVVVNMVASIDGATAIGGVTQPLGSDTDRAIFLHLREVADAVLVGASTVRAEGYGPARPSKTSQAVRLNRGQLARPPIAVVSRSLRFDWEAPFFTDANPRPILIVPADTDPQSRERAGQVAEVVATGDGSVDIRQALARLRAGGVKVLLCEGGPTLNAELLAAGLIDEVCLTVAPLLAGGDSPKGIVGFGPRVEAATFSLVHVLEQSGYLFLRYRVENQQNL